MPDDKPNLDAPVKVENSDVVGLVEGSGADMKAHPEKLHFILCHAFSENSGIYQRDDVPAPPGAILVD